MIFNDKISMTIQLNDEYLLPVYHSQVRLSMMCVCQQFKIISKENLRSGL